MSSDNQPLVALVDLDGTVADYDRRMAEEMDKLRAPDEPFYAPRMIDDVEPPHLEARRKLVQQMPGFWRSLPVLPLGMRVVDLLRDFGFELHTLTKGPSNNGPAWGEKLEWSRARLPDAIVTVTMDKQYTYGRVLFDDFPPYFNGWRKSRPRGLVICHAQPWNDAYRVGGPLYDPLIHRVRDECEDGGKSFEALKPLLERARSRASGEPF